MRNWRKMTWLIVVVNILMLVLIVSAASSANCEAEEFVEACEAGTGIGVGIVIVLWAAVDVILGVLWLVTKGSARDCPTCGRGVKKGLTVCKSCGHNFRSAVAI